ncbi:MAG: 1,2-phenylacetyl-CoA epoxidase subunit PaaE [Lautropia sp.]|nr:1,2-phenylacetyl-CoA epoxidase subunit PaaE [Lautropia sp.]
MARFHPLQVVDVQRETRDAVVVTLKPMVDDEAAFRFIPGQYLTFRRDFDGTELRRSYSICSGLDDGVLKIGIKRVEGGAFSTWANESLRAGEMLEAMPPMGNFHVPIEPDQQHHYLGFAVGSGITPILSIIKSTLAREPKSRFTLVYANRQISSVMFREELEDLKNLYLGRFSVIHIFNSDGQEIDLFTGRLDRRKCEELLTRWIDLKSVNTAFICGPESMMVTVSEVLAEYGMPKERIKFELFGTGQGRAAQRRTSAAGAASAARCEVSVTLDGVARSFSFAMQGVSVLDAALEQSMEAPYACKAGVCSTCKCKVVEGKVEMLVNHALEDYEVEQGYVLSCQAYPLTERLAVSYDE